MSSQDPVFDSSFQPRLLHPRYWPSWLALGALGVFAFVPPRWRDRLADALAPLVLKISKKQVYIARTNLAICFKEKSEAERDAILMASIRVGLKSLLGFGERCWRQRCFGRSNLLRQQHRNPLQATGSRPAKVSFRVEKKWHCGRPADQRLQLCLVQAVARVRELLLRLEPSVRAPDLQGYLILAGVHCTLPRHLSVRRRTFGAAHT